MQVPMGITRRSDGVWRNIYTNEKISPEFITNWWGADPETFGYQDYAYTQIEKYYDPACMRTCTQQIRTKWKLNNFESPSSNARTACIAPQEGESTEIDFCGTGFHDCHEGASCTNGGDAGYTCECQSLQFGDVKVQPVDVAGTGRSCSYIMPGYENKTLFPIRVYDNAGSDTVYAFHGSSEKHNLGEAIRYCRELGMHLPLPKNDKENIAMRKVFSFAGWLDKYDYRTPFYRLGLHDSDNDDTFLNIYTEKETPFTNWHNNEPGSWWLPDFQVSKPRASVGLSVSGGDWYAMMDEERLTFCQDGGIDVSQIDWCGSGLHNCHAEANCLPSGDENNGDDYRCACKYPDQYTGNGVGENGCVFNLESKFIIDNYNVDVTIIDRYVRTQIAVSVTNMNIRGDELYKFGVNLDQFKLISGFTMRMGDDGAVSIGDVRKEKEAEEIFDHAVSNGSDGDQSEPQAESHTETEAESATDAKVTHTEPDRHGDTTFLAKAGFQKFNFLMFSFLFLVYLNTNYDYSLCKSISFKLIISVIYKNRFYLEPLIKVIIPAGETLYIWLNYDMQLTRENAIYAFTTNVFPYQPVSKMSVSVTIEESRNIDAKKTSVYWESEGKPESQRFARNQENAFDLNKASANKWEFSFEKESIDLEKWNDNLNIEYDVERLDNTCGDIVMRDGYFIHYILPKRLGSIPKNVILSIDISDDMRWGRLDNAKSALITILDTLTDKDTFWLQAVSYWAESWKSEAVRATTANVARAKVWVNKLQTSWSSNTGWYKGIYNLVQQPIDNRRSNIAFIITDGPTGSLSAGYNSGWSDVQAGILAANSIKNNNGEEIGQKWALFHYDFGPSRTSNHLKKLSNLHMGTHRTAMYRTNPEVYDIEDVPAELTSFFNEYSSPLIWNNQFHYEGASKYDCSRTNLYDDQELTCIGELPKSEECSGFKDLGFTPGNTLLVGVSKMDVS